MVVPLLLLLVSLMMLSDVIAVNETTINAVVVGKRGEVNLTQYTMIADALQNSDNKYCRINFSVLEYDQSNGSSLASSLRHARQTFSDESVAVAIGPQIDVFTSTDYVILHQIHFVTSSGQLVDQGYRTMPILPDPKSLSTAVAKIVKYLDWNTVAFLSQEDFSPVLALGGEKVFVSPIRLPTDISTHDNPQLQQTLTTLRESQMDKFILHSMDKTVVKHVLNAAQKLHLLHNSIRWFITYLDFADIAEDIQGMAKIYGLQLLKVDNYPPQLDNLFGEVEVSRLQRGLMSDVVGIISHYLNAQDCSIEPSYNSTMSALEFKKALTNEIYSYSGALGDYIWPKLNDEETSNIRNDYTIPIYRFISGPEKFAEVYFQRKETVVRSILSKEEPYVAQAFKDKFFSVIAKTDEPFVMRKPGGGYEGFCVDVLEELSRSLSNFKYNITELDEQRILHNGKTSIWDDIITELKVGNASMAIGAFAVTADRQTKISFSYTIISSSVSLLVKRPPDTVNYFQFLWPFSRNLWMMIMVFVMAVGIGLYLTARFDSTQNYVEAKFDLKESMWYSLTVLLQGTSESSPQTTSMRTIVAFFWFCTLVINAAYTANLAAFLTLQQIDDRITSVDHLARQTSTKYGVLNNSDLMHFFKESRSDPYERMWTFMKLNEDVSLLSARATGVNYVLEKDYAYLDDGVINNYMAQKNCRVESIEQNFGVKHFSMGFPKGAPYRGDINRALLELKEDGTLDTLRNKWWKESSCVEDTPGSKPKANTASELNISNMFGVFIVLIAFTTLAVLYEIGYVVWKVVRSRQKKKNTAKSAEKENDVQFSAQPTFDDD